VDRRAVRRGHEPVEVSVNPSEGGIQDQAGTGEELNTELGLSPGVAGSRRQGPSLAVLSAGRRRGGTGVKVERPERSEDERP
jgi:hypothetical protein